ncbi:hypothetical protein ACOI1C_02220 [Bacillus sp. DJP31]|uniref:hypothetical protein n=1 Tax=Bacillus sp. DJP31 TaxID=3409789 RepID=UPI003BB4BCF3
MSSLQDTLYNWLTIKIVADARKDDVSAQETTEMFYDILTKDLALRNIQVEKADQMYLVHYIIGDESKSTKFPIELIDVMLQQMEAEPEKFKNYPELK